MLVGSRFSANKLWKRAKIEQESIFISVSHCSTTGQDYSIVFDEGALFDLSSVVVV